MLCEYVELYIEIEIARMVFLDCWSPLSHNGYQVTLFSQSFILMQGSEINT